MIDNIFKLLQTGFVKSQKVYIQNWFFKFIGTSPLISDFFGLRDVTNGPRAIQALADLECGYDGIITSSGMSAIFAVLQLLKGGERILAPHDCYGGTFRLFKSYAEKGLITLDFVDQTDEQALTKALAKKPKIVWLETPSNPLLRIVDIEKISKLAKENPKI